MYKTIARFTAVAAVGLMVAGCGSNPFGPGYAGGLGIFAKIAQAVQKPVAINKEESGKDGARGIVAEGATMAKRLAKSAVGTADPAWLIDKDIIVSGDTVKYFEIVADKPSEEDPDKKVTGRAEVGFKYNGTAPTTLADVNTALITNVYYWSFVGHEEKTWNTEVCSLVAKVTFSATSVADPKPGLTRLWGKNISATIAQGQGDTTLFTLDSLDDVNTTQYGRGEYLDAHKGDDPATSAFFGYKIKIIHKNLLDPTKPYQRWQDNEGEVEFALPWGKNNTDSLYFMVHFYPDYKRSGTITDDNGKVRVRFVKYEKPGIGSDVTTFYDEDGNVVSN